MAAHEAGRITQLLLQWSAGDTFARDQLMPLVYDELHKLARAYLRREKNPSLQPTALVNDAYIRLVAQSNVSWESRAQFFGLASTMMRNILVDYARRNEAAKRGGHQLKVSLSDAQGIYGQPDLDLLVLDAALTDLERHYPEHSRVIELRFFGGLNIEKTAEVLGLSHATVERHWKFARAWLRNKMRQ